MTITPSHLGTQYVLRTRPSCAFQFTIRAGEALRSINMPGSVIFIGFFVCVNGIRKEKDCGPIVANRGGVLQVWGKLVDDRAVGD